jgi:hypothetical protein
MYPSEDVVKKDLDILKKLMSSNDTLLCQVMREKYLKILPKDGALAKVWEFTRTDEIAMALLPEDIPHSCVPKKVSGDGNCLYNSISVILIGNQRLSASLRLLTAIELFLNPMFYADHPK